MRPLQEEYRGVKHGHKQGKKNIQREERTLGARTQDRQEQEKTLQCCKNDPWDKINYKNITSVQGIFYVMIV